MTQRGPAEEAVSVRRGGTGLKTLFLSVCGNLQHIGQNVTCLKCFASKALRREVSGMNWENTCAFILVSIKPITCHKINQSNGIGQNEV